MLSKNANRRKFFENFAITLFVTLLITCVLSNFLLNRIKKLENECKVQNTTLEGY